MLSNCSKQLSLWFFVALTIAHFIACFNDESFIGDSTLPNERVSRYDKTELVGLLNRLFSAASPGSRYLYEDDMYGGAKRSGGAPAPGFIGVRGKKGSGIPPGFVGTRGKKPHPWMAIPQGEVSYRR